MIMLQSQLSHTVVVPLTDTMHEQAEDLCPTYLSSAQSEPIYLNGLSLLVVDHYLKRLGYLTRPQTGSVANSMLQSLSDVAPIEVLAPADGTVQGDRAAQQLYGTLECRRVMPNESTVRISESVLNLERIGCVVVQFDDELSEARVLGYVQPQDLMLDIALEEVRSLDTFCDYLEAIRPEPEVDLVSWFDQVFQKGWELVDAVIATQATPTLSPVRCSRSKQVERGHIVTIGKSDKQVSLVLTVDQLAEHQFKVGVEFWPASGSYLPPNLQLEILDEQGQVVIPAQTDDTSEQVTITLEAERGDRFQVRMANGPESTTQHFTL